MAGTGGKKMALSDNGLQRASQWEKARGGMAGRADKVDNLGRALPSRRQMLLVRKSLPPGDLRRRRTAAHSTSPGVCTRGC